MKTKLTEALFPFQIYWKDNLPLTNLAHILNTLHFSLCVIGMVGLTLTLVLPSEELIQGDWFVDLMGFIIFGTVFYYILREQYRGLKKLHEQNEKSG